MFLRDAKGSTVFAVDDGSSVVVEVGRLDVLLKLGLGLYPLGSREATSISWNWIPSTLFLSVGVASVVVVLVVVVLDVVVVVDASELLEISGDDEASDEGSLKPGGKKFGDTSAKRMLEKMLVGSFRGFSVVVKITGEEVVVVGTVVKVGKDGIIAAE